MTLAPLTTIAANLPATAAAILAQSTRSLSIPWAIVLFCVILGLLVTLSPSRRTTEIKRAKDD